MENIKKLRSQTGAGIVDCKKALEEANGSYEEALEILRKKGIAKASKRADNEANEGVVKVGVSDDGKVGFILQFNCETDFVARNQDFSNVADEIFVKIKENSPESLEEVKNISTDKGTVEERVDNLSGTIKEKIVLSKYEKVEGESVAAYSHMGGNIACLVALDTPGKEDVALDVAMQVAAINPSYIKPEDVPAEEIEKEKAIYKEELVNAGKPEEIIDKIIEGKINKYLEEVCLVKQEFIKDDKKKVEDILDGAQVKKMVRYSLGS